jgi:hypothetical protein
MTVQNQSSKANSRKEKLYPEFMAIAQEIAEYWRQYLQANCPQYSAAVHESIIGWLLGEDTARYDRLGPEQLTIAKQAMDYRFRILQQRYLGVGQERAYQNLMQRLGSLLLIRNKIRTWIALSRDRQRSVLDVLQEIIQEMLQSDRYMQQQMQWIAHCTPDKRLRNSLVLATTEEYCLRPIRNQPLLVFRFVNYLRRSQKGGMTQVPDKDFIRLVSEDVILDESDSAASLLDSQAVNQYQDNQAWEEQQIHRQAVKQEFATYLAEHVDPMAARWLNLYLQGYTQDMIAQILGIDIKKIYRLREKVNYHAIRVFATKHKPELVANWLETSLQDHSLGLTPQQWQKFWANTTSVQQQIVDKLKAGVPVAQIAKELNLKADQVMGEWSKLYLVAQELRSED